MSRAGGGLEGDNWAMTIPYVKYESRRGAEGGVFKLLHPETRLEKSAFTEFIGGGGGRDGTYDQAGVWSHIRMLLKVISVCGLRLLLYILPETSPACVKVRA